jgi:hypothetical protein
MMALTWRLAGRAAAPYLIGEGAGSDEETG